MGKKIIIKGADFSQVAIDDGFNPLIWFVTTVDNICLGVPVGYAIAKSSSVSNPKTEVGIVSPVSGQGMYYYGPISGLNSPRFATKQAVSLKPLHDNGYTSLKITPVTTGNIMIVYSRTPTVSSINPIDSGQSIYNSSTSQVTIPIYEDTYVFFQAKSLTDDPSITTSGTITDWLNISFE